jgi:hypothetical protein
VQEAFLFGGGTANHHALRVVQNRGADLCHLGGRLAGGVNYFRHPFAGGAAQVEDGELVKVADLTLSQALGGLGRGEVAAGDGG